MDLVLGKDLTLKAGNRNHRRYMPEMIELVRSGVIRPEQFLTQDESLISAIDAYRAFERHQSGWIKMKLDPTQHNQCSGVLEVHLGGLATNPSSIRTESFSIRSGCSDCLGHNRRNCDGNSVKAQSTQARKLFEDYGRQVTAHCSADTL